MSTKPKYRSMTTAQRRHAVANELRRLTDQYGEISRNRWSEMRDRSYGLPGVEVAMRLFNTTSWPQTCARAFAYRGGDVPGDEDTAAKFRDQRLNRKGYRRGLIDGELDEVIDAMSEKAAPRDWQSQPMALLANGKARPRIGTTIRHGGSLSRPCGMVAVDSGMGNNQRAQPIGCALTIYIYRRSERRKSFTLEQIRT